MKRILLCLLLAGCGQTNEPIQPKIEYTITPWMVSFNEVEYIYAYEGYVRNTGSIDISPIYPKINWNTQGLEEVSYGFLGDKPEQIFDGARNPTTKLRRGEERYFFVKTRVLRAETKTTFSFQY